MRTGFLAVFLVFGLFLASAQAAKIVSANQGPFEINSENVEVFGHLASTHFLKITYTDENGVESAISIGHFMDPIFAEQLKTILDHQNFVLYVKSLRTRNAKVLSRGDWITFYLDSYLSRDRESIKTFIRKVFPDKIKDRYVGGHK